MARQSYVEKIAVLNIAAELAFYYYLSRYPCDDRKCKKQLAVFPPCQQCQRARKYPSEEVLEKIKNECEENKINFGRVKMESTSAAAYLYNRTLNPNTDFSLIRKFSQIPPKKRNAQAKFFVQCVEGKNPDINRVGAPSLLKQLQNVLTGRTR